MPNITLSIDEALLKTVRKIAIDKNTTLTAMIRDYLRSVAELSAIEKKQVVQELNDSFTRFSRDMGDRKWTRESLHER